MAEAAAPSPSDKPAILRDERFVVEDGLAYRAFSRAAIWLNKMWLAALVLLFIWIVVGATTGQSACAAGVDPATASGNATDVPAAKGTCSIFLTPTSLYLAAMTILAFALQITCGLLGNAIGRKIIAATPADQEPGAPKS